ncbi:sucrose-6-phosphate hydrolase-like [Spodoptera frugiperda]|uniref:Sucrose-6-phosphate hydrolase n=1 Tax=Spodoptera frugiperda TaxID=7108 RepID=A0A9R0CXM6_SPOFR|nr:sucrose-6-phosphate hydrolase-like [Spodoptera frugiperda]
MHISTYIILMCLGSVQLDQLKEILEKAELEIYIEETIPTVNPRYKLQYHITPPVGWMNGPNGFVFYKGEYHLFYQFYPYDTQWGPMHWGHVSSTNLVDWKTLPTALRPGNEQCFSGSAIDNEGIMVLLYTAHQATEDAPFYNESQYMAFSIDGLDFHKYKGNPVDILPPTGTQDFRDPKIWKYGNFWYVVLGSKTADHRGSVLLYRSKNLLSWEFKSILAESSGSLGYMWECPDFFEINGKYVLMISPQGMVSRGDRYKNTYQTGYLIGSFSYDTCQFKPEINFQELDYGHDFYTTQTTETNGKRYLVGWFGMWESLHLEDIDGWVGAMTLVRELDLVGSRVLMKPVEAITKLRLETIIEGEFHHNATIEFEKAGEIIVNIDLSENIELEFVGSNGGDRTSLRWSVDDGKVIVDRAGDIRQGIWEPLDTVTWRIFLDASSIEVFCGEGEMVFSSRVYPNGDWRVINRGPQSLHVVAYTLKKFQPDL